LLFSFFVIFVVCFKRFDAKLMLEHHIRIFMRSVDRFDFLFVLFSTFVSEVEIFQFLFFYSSFFRLSSVSNSWNDHFLN